VSPSAAAGASDIEARFSSLWRSLSPIGRDPATGGYLRYSFTPADLACREWFVRQARDRSLPVETDGNGNLWAWWGDPAAGGAVVTGSHLDSVPHGGAYDGPLGIVSAFLAIDVLRGRGIAPARPVGVVAFVEEEGSRFGVACLGSRLLTGAMSADRARDLADAAGVRLDQAMAEVGLDPAAMGADPSRLARIASYVELHVEQGRALDTHAVGLASGIWPHGRWRLEFAGVGNHAGTTPMSDRHDPTLTCAYTVLAANKEARLAGAHATIGRIAVTPNATNAVPERVTAWLDARAAEQSLLDSVVGRIEQRARERAARDGTTVAVTAESVSAEVRFDDDLRQRLAGVLGSVPVIGTGAGHDAGVLQSAGVPTAMLFVRNPTGVSHSPAEHAADADCAAGVAALAAALEELACR
jgi:N-carbamoyl-L-amino-acid hydrolase